MNQKGRVAVALCGLRLSVFLVMLMWTLDKLVNPSHSASVYENFYLVHGISHSMLAVLAVAELALLLGFVSGYRKRLTYGVVLGLHAISTLSSYRQYFAPFEHLLFFAAWPMLAACFALYSLRDLDTLWTIKRPAARLEFSGHVEKAPIR